MAEIGIYGGSFNPIHTGHIQLAQYILHHTDMDEVWFMVSPNNPLKQGSELVEQSKRLRWVEASLDGYDGLLASDFEFSLPQPSYTIRTLQSLQEVYPNHHFTLIIGADNLSLFKRWKDWDTILRDYAITVYPREGIEIEPLQAEYPTVTFLPQAPLYPISSTEIRQQLRKGGDMEQWIPPCIYADVRNTFCAPRKC